MRGVISSAKERTLIYLGLVSALVSMAALFAFVFAPTLESSAYAGGVAIVSLCICGLVARGGHGRKVGAPTNTQLQQPPPAIVERHRNDASASA